MNDKGVLNLKSILRAFGQSPAGSCGELFETFPTLAVLKLDLVNEKVAPMPVVYEYVEAILNTLKGYKQGDILPTIEAPPQDSYRQDYIRSITSSSVDREIEAETKSLEISEPRKVYLGYAHLEVSEQISEVLGAEALETDSMHSTVMLSGDSDPWSGQTVTHKLYQLNAAIEAIEAVTSDLAFHAALRHNMFMFNARHFERYGAPMSRVLGDEESKLSQNMNIYARFGEMSQCLPSADQHVIEHIMMSHLFDLKVALCVIRDFLGLCVTASQDVDLPDYIQLIDDHIDMIIACYRLLRSSEFQPVPVRQVADTFRTNCIALVQKALNIEKLADAKNLFLLASRHSGILSEKIHITVDCRNHDRVVGQYNPVAAEVMVLNPASEVDDAFHRLIYALSILKWQGFFNSDQTLHYPHDAQGLSEWLSVFHEAITLSRSQCEEKMAMGGLEIPSVADMFTLGKPVRLDVVQGLSASIASKAILGCLSEETIRSYLDERHGPEASEEEVLARLVVQCQQAAQRKQDIYLACGRMLAGVSEEPLSYEVLLSARLTEEHTKREKSDLSRTSSALESALKRVSDRSLIDSQGSSDEDINWEITLRDDESNWCGLVQAKSLFLQLMKFLPPNPSFRILDKRFWEKDLSAKGYVRDLRGGRGSRRLYHRHSFYLSFHDTAGTPGIVRFTDLITVLRKNLPSIKQPQDALFFRIMLMWAELRVNALYYHCWHDNIRDDNANRLFPHLTAFSKMIIAAGHDLQWVHVMQQLMVCINSLDVSVPKRRWLKLSRVGMGYMAQLLHYLHRTLLEQSNSGTRVSYPSFDGLVDMSRRHLNLAYGQFLIRAGGVSQVSAAEARYRQKMAATLGYPTWIALLLDFTIKMAQEDDSYFKPLDGTDDLLRLLGVENELPDARSSGDENLTYKCRALVLAWYHIFTLSIGTLCDLFFHLNKPGLAKNEKLQYLSEERGPYIGRRGQTHARRLILTLIKQTLHSRLSDHRPLEKNVQLIVKDAEGKMQWSMQLISACQRALSPLNHWQESLEGSRPSAQEGQVPYVSEDKAKQIFGRVYNTLGIATGRVSMPYPRTATAFEKLFRAGREGCPDGYHPGPLVSEL